MKEEVIKLQKYSVGHHIDKQLLLSLEDIFKQYNPEMKLEISVECSNSIVYKFDDIEECFEYFEKVPYRIVEVEIEARFGGGNKVGIIFSNKFYAKTEARFIFDNSDGYLVLKNKIELCLKNFRTNYWVLSVTPMTSIILTAIFIGICIYTGEKNIVFPTYIQCIICGLWFLGSTLFAFFVPLIKIKRNIFPCTEFRIGQNVMIEKRNEKKRGFIIGTVCIGTVLGIIVNYLSSLLF